MFEKRNSTEQVQLRRPIKRNSTKAEKLISCIALVLGVAIIPLMYSGIYLASVWDTYGRLDTLPVAVMKTMTKVRKSMERNVTWAKNSLIKWKSLKIWIGLLQMKLMQKQV